MEKAKVIPEERLTNGYLQEVGEYGEEMLLDFIIDYMVHINNDPREAYHVDGLTINKTALDIFYDLGIILPFNFGRAPVYNPLIFKKLENFCFDCGFHPGKYFSKSIVIRERKRLELNKKNIDRMKYEVDTYLKVYCGMTLKGLMDRLDNVAASLKGKTEKDQFAKKVDQKHIGELTDSMKMDYMINQVEDRIHEIDPNTRNIIEEIDSILQPIPNRLRPIYEDKVDMERKIKEAFKKSRLPSTRERKLRIRKEAHWRSEEFDYVLNREFLEAAKEEDGTAKVVVCDGKRYLVFRGTWKRTFIGTRWDPKEEYNISHVHYYFMDVTEESSEKIEGFVKKLERCLYGIVAKRFPITEWIRDQLETDEKTALENKWLRFYQLSKQRNEWSGDMNPVPPQFDPIPKYARLVLATLAIKSEPNIPLTGEEIEQYLEKIEIETLISWGNYEISEILCSFENDSPSFKELYEILSRHYFEGKPLVERLRYLSSALTGLLPAGYISENTRPLRLKTLLSEKKSCCEGYVLVLGFLFHLWQNIFPELLEADIRLYLLPDEILNSVVREYEFKEPHMFITVKINDRPEIVDPTNRIWNRMIRKNAGLGELLQEDEYFRSYRIRKIGGESHG